MSHSAEDSKRGKHRRIRPNLTENMESTLAGEVKTADFGFDFIKDTNKMKFTENKKLPTINEENSENNKSKTSIDPSKRVTLSSSESDDDNDLSDISDSDSDNDSSKDKKNDSPSKFKSSVKGSSFTDGVDKEDLKTGFKFDKEAREDADKLVDSDVPLTKKQKERKKIELLYEFANMKAKGIKLAKNYTINSDLDDMLFEYNKILNQKNVANSIKVQRNMMMTIISIMEFANKKYDPFGFKLDGWSESIHENIDDYDDIFEELYNKHNTKVKAPPEVRLLFMLLTSAFMFHFTKSMLDGGLGGGGGGGLASVMSSLMQGGGAFPQGGGGGNGGNNVVSDSGDMRPPQGFDDIL